MVNAASESLFLAPNDAHPDDDEDGEVRVMQVLANWHNETHAGAFRTCQEQPCHAAQKAVWWT